MTPKTNTLQIRNSTAEFLIFTGQAGENGISINEHMAKLFESGEISREATIRNFLIVAAVQVTGFSYSEIPDNCCNLRKKWP